MFVSMRDRYSQLELWRRSLAMLPPGTPAGLSREEAMGLLAELQGLEDRLRRLRDGIERTLAVDNSA
jgi:hypothetical protein